MNPEHGKLVSWNNPPSHDPWFCPHSDHSGNGAFFLDAHLSDGGGHTLASQLEEVLASVLAGDLQLSEAVDIAARRSNQSRTNIQAYLEARLRSARNFAEAKQARATGTPIPHAAYTVARHKREAVPLLPPSEFMRVMNEAGLSKKEAAEAIGRSVSRVHELTTSQGGNQKLFDNFVACIQAYVAKQSEA
jgi:hypothetical protein